MAIVGDFVAGLDRINLLHQGVNQTPKLLVIHYSVTNTVEQAVSALNQRRLSYHVLIAKDGRAFQTRPFTKTAAHPGLSNWKAGEGVDFGTTVANGSIGICLMNIGFATTGLPSISIADGKLIYNPDDQSMQRWEIFPPAQIAVCKAIAQDIISTYPIQDVVGHHDIAIMGKFDPGPLFDLASLNAMVTTPKSLGFSTRVRSNDGFLNLRRGPSTSTSVIKALPHGTPVHPRHRLRPTLEIHPPKHAHQPGALSDTMGLRRRGRHQRACGLRAYERLGRNAACAVPCGKAVRWEAFRVGIAAGGDMEFAGLGKPLIQESLDEAAAIVGVPNSEMWAVIEVECSGCGYLSDRRPKILFERHKFSKATGRQFDASHPGISNPSPDGFGAGGAHQYERLGQALALDRKAALSSASWGIGQVLGSNFAVAGFADVEDMVAKMVASERHQLLAMFNFIEGNNLGRHLRDLGKVCPRLQRP